MDQTLRLGLKLVRSTEEFKKGGAGFWRSGMEPEIFPLNLFH